MSTSYRDFSQANQLLAGNGSHTGLKIKTYQNDECAVDTNQGQYGPPSAASTTSTQTPIKETSSSVSSSLPLKLLGDAAVGIGVTFLMAPSLTIADRAISQRAAGTHTLVQSGLLSLQSMVRNPIAYARSPAFLYVWAVYAATYTTANSLKTIVEHQEQTRRLSAAVEESQGNNASIGKLGIFLGTSLANSGASVWKDRAFAYMFATNSAVTPQKVPLASYGFWLSRDLIGVGSSFVLPDLIAKNLSETAANPEEYEKYRDLSQLCVPIATQFVAGPLHLLGLDIFNRPMQGMTWRGTILERSKFLLNGYAAVVSARIARIIPGYGFGGVLNSKYRDSWREYLMQGDMDRISFRFPSRVSATSDQTQGDERAARLFTLIRNMQANGTLEA
jgi:hypothetical protein